MIQWIVNVIMLLAGLIAGAFVGYEALNYQFVQMIIGIIIFTLIVFFIAFLPKIKELIKNILKK